LASGELRLGHIVLDGGDVYWVEGRPEEEGRSVVVRRRADGGISDATPPGTNVRTRVQEYGGAAYIVSDGVIYFSEFSDQRLYRLKSGGVPEPMTPPGPCRYADATVDARRRRLICVREGHAIRGREPFSDSANPKKAPDPELPPPDPETTIVAIPLDGPETEGDVLASGSDFYSTPRLSPDASRLAWLSWRHPNMPWNGTELWLADVGADGRLEHARTIAGGDNESIYQPGWSPDGVLHFVSDRTNWWNLYRAHHGEIEAVYPIDADCGRPQWLLGSATWSFTDDRTLVVARAQVGRWTLRRLILSSSTDALRIADDTELTAFEPGEYLVANPSYVVFLGGSPDTPDAIVQIDLSTRTAETVRASSAAPDAATLSLPQAIEFPTEDGLTAHAFF
jgi:dipeptidyl aminopeptidase/acylaminoacyl peptidase